jgi:hypothetical protein
MALSPAPPPTSRTVAPPAREAKACACDCGAVTRGGKYVPGHDTRVAFRLLREQPPA